MRFIFVVNDVFQVDPFGLVQVIEEFLVEDKRHTGNLFNVALGVRVPVTKKKCDAFGEIECKLPW